MFLRFNDPKEIKLKATCNVYFGAVELHLYSQSMVATCVKKGIHKIQKTILRVWVKKLSAKFLETVKVPKYSLCPLLAFLKEDGFDKYL